MKKKAEVTKTHKQEVQFHFNVYFSRQKVLRVTDGTYAETLVVSALLSKHEH